jgi:hypothetical protein
MCKRKNRREIERKEGERKEREKKRKEENKMGKETKIDRYKNRCVCR